MAEDRVERLRREASRFRNQMNQRFIDRRVEEGVWNDPRRGTGIQVTLEALDTVLTQISILRQAVPYESKYLLEDFQIVREEIAAKEGGEAFPLSGVGDKRSSPETAALVLRLPSHLVPHLQHSGAWSHDLAKDFNLLSDLALDFLIGSFRKEESKSGAGGWGVFQDVARPQLYFTVMVVRALVDYVRLEQVSQEKRQKIGSLLSQAHEYLRACREGPRFCKELPATQLQWTYSAYGLLGMLMIHDHNPSAIEFENDALPVFQYHEDKRLASQDADTIRHYSMIDEGRQYQDASGPWSWARCIMLWLGLHPNFFEERRHRQAEGLLRVLLDMEMPNEIYLWNRAALALAGYEQHALRQLRSSNHALRKILFEMFRDPAMAQAAYDYLANKLR